MRPSRPHEGGHREDLLALAVHHLRHHLFGAADSGQPSIEPHDLAEAPRTRSRAPHADRRRLPPLDAHYPFRTPGKKPQPAVSATTTDHSVAGSTPIRVAAAVRPSLCSGPAAPAKSMRIAANLGEPTLRPCGTMLIINQTHPLINQTQIRLLIQVNELDIRFHEMLRVLIRSN
jgi:hypothetical protein